ncbi:hypothetical protein Tsp_09768 [Trichinella spiralis]|uniref:hypothetical protein n=1 Tax=Trichinella spiralis TaxID=6334 RepID=UPI0001EFD93D|nr:hypothetical protein Tsp_09768 [Trichinella spiralis]
MPLERLISVLHLIQMMTVLTVHLQYRTVTNSMQLNSFHSKIALQLKKSKCLLLKCRPTQHLRVHVPSTYLLTGSCVCIFTNFVDFSVYALTSGQNESSPEGSASNHDHGRLLANPSTTPLSSSALSSYHGGLSSGLANDFQLPSSDLNLLGNFSSAVLLGNWSGQSTLGLSTASHGLAVNELANLNESNLQNTGDTTTLVHNSISVKQEPVTSRGGKTDQMRCQITRTGNNTLSNYPPTTDIGDNAERSTFKDQPPQFASTKRNSSAESGSCMHVNISLLSLFAQQLAMLNQQKKIMESIFSNSLLIMFSKMLCTLENGRLIQKQMAMKAGDKDTEIIREINGNEMLTWYDNFLKISNWKVENFDIYLVQTKAYLLSLSVLYAEQSSQRHFTSSNHGLIPYACLHFCEDAFPLDFKLRFLSFHVCTIPSGTGSKFHPFSLQRLRLYSDLPVCLLTSDLFGCPVEPMYYNINDSFMLNSVDFAPRIAPKDLHIFMANLTKLMRVSIAAAVATAFNFLSSNALTINNSLFWLNNTQRLPRWPFIKKSVFCIFSVA